MRFFATFSRKNLRFELELCEKLALNMRFDVAGRHAFRIHGQDLLFDILTDAGLVLFQKLRFKFTFPVTGNRNLDIAKTGSQIFAAVAVPAVVRSFVLIVVFAVTKILIQFGPPIHSP